MTKPLSRLFFHFHSFCPNLLFHHFALGLKVRFLLCPCYMERCSAKAFCSLSYKMPADGDQDWIPLPLMHGPNMLWEWKPETLAQRTAFTAFPVAGTARSASPCVMWWFTSPQFALWELLWKLLLYSKSWQHLAFIWGWVHGLYIKAISFFPLEIPCGINLFVSTNQMAVWDPQDDVEYAVLSF